ncbi:hypothetical protein VP01_2362g3 [Puccinia sorghi]|uniref:Uncharacterized protein n=1 Tax=Puccinia sorghi TaxID=27349 RepID=A0A0L6V929_9BASI|nr:hypothetical protein VP01_2362g3 [Puccinia sorghi]
MIRSRISSSVPFSCSAHDSSASNNDDTSSKRSDTPLGQSAPSSHNVSVGPSSHRTNVSHLLEPAANQGPPSLTNHESSNREPSIEVVDQQQPVTGSHQPSQAVSMNLSDTCNDLLESNTVPRPNGKHRLVVFSDSSDDSDVDHQMESAIVPPCSGQLVKSQMQPTQSSRGLLKSLNDLKRYPTRQRKLPNYNGQLQADKAVDSDGRSCIETESASEEEEELVPHRGNQEEEEWVPHHMHTDYRTQSGRPFREPNPLDRSSSPDVLHHDDEPSIMNPETNNELPQDSGNLSCKDLHQQMASQIAALQTSHQLSIDQIDKVLKAIDELRKKVTATQPTSRVSRATQQSQRPPAQRSDLRRLLRQHCSILLGWSTEKKRFPQPATEGERSKWGEPIDQSSHEGQSELYVHKAATDQQVKIIKNIMLQAGVRRFAPNFLQPPNAPDNKFLWQLAQQSFTELLRCGEYKVNFQLQDPQIISQEIGKYVRETLSRRYKQEHLWPQSKQCNHATTLKRNSRQLHKIWSLPSKRPAVTMKLMTRRHLRGISGEAANTATYC